jgi:hypothetical protein
LNIRVELQIKENKTPLLLEEINNRIQKIFKMNRSYWEAGDNFSELVLVQDSPTLEELIDKLGMLLIKNIRFNVFKNRETVFMQ